jgi:hypothetical protein
MKSADDIVEDSMEDAVAAEDKAARSFGEDAYSDYFTE